MPWPGSFTLRGFVMITILFLAADPTNAARLRLGEEVREIREKLRLSKSWDQFVLEQRLSVRPMDISQALLDLNPQIVHFSGHGTSEGALCVEDRIGNVQTIQPEALAALFEMFAREVDCVILNACFSTIQAQAIARYVGSVIGMEQEIADQAAIAFAVGFYQALGAGRNIKEAYKLGCVQMRLEGVSGHLTPILMKSDAVRDNFSPLISQPDGQSLRKDIPPVKPPAVSKPTNLGFEKSREGDYPVGWFNSLGLVDFVSTSYDATVVMRPDDGIGMCVLFRNLKAGREEFGSLMQRYPAQHLAGEFVRFEGEVRTRNIEQWAGLWLRADAATKFNLYFYNMSDRPIRGSTPWTTYVITAQLPRETMWLNYGILLEGRGAMWADNFRVSVWRGSRWLDE